MSVTELPSGVAVDLSADRLGRFCREEWAYYDGIVDDTPDEIVPIDVLATLAMNSYIQGAASIRQIHRDVARRCNWLLSEIPVNADLTTYDLDLSIARGLLSEACSVRGVLLAVATKILHRKRRSYIPMLDNVIVNAYLEAAGRTALKNRAQEADGAPGVGVYVMDRFRRDLEAASEPLQSMASDLAAAGTPMTSVRILEVMTWMSIEPVGYYRSD
jgi:hypothetical protein